MTGVKAAVFDLDNTLVRGSSLFHFGVQMARRRRVPARHVLRFAWAEAAYVLGRTEPEGIGGTVAERTLAIVAGMRQVDLLDLADDFAERRLHRHLNADVYLQVIDFKRAGYLTLLATASPQELASATARALGMHAAIGTIAETREGVYTGRLDGPVAHGSAKAHRVAGFFSEHGVDAHSSWAFSDSINDLPLLSLVGNPVATHADRDLAAIAGTNGWRTLGEAADSDASVARLQTLYPFPF